MTATKIIEKGIFLPVVFEKLLKVQNILTIILDILDNVTFAGHPFSFPCF